MKVFLSWSGERSRKIANELREWLPLTLQAIDPWMSSSDVQAGARWASELQFQLQESRFGIICLTPENINAPWLLYEAGALAKSLETAYVCPYLFGFSATDLTGPLVQFQAVTADKNGTRQLLRTLNRAISDNGLADNMLDKVFAVWWPALDDILNRIAQERGTNSLTSKVEHAPSNSETTVEGLIQRILAPTQSEDNNVKKKPREYVFVVHGHDEAKKEAVARVIESLGPAVLILHERPNQGRTIIEKLEDLSSVSYAVVVMTADDLGKSSKNPPRVQQSRARQNVIFELGYFSAKLGRNRTCVLYEEDIEMPSDFSGVLYIQLDPNGVWRFHLARELKRAGLTVDVNNIL